MAEEEARKSAASRSHAQEKGVSGHEHPTMLSRHAWTKIGVTAASYAVGTVSSSLLGSHQDSVVRAPLARL
jgi:hypothetical protein